MGLLGEVVGKLAGTAAGAVVNPIMSAVGAGLGILERLIPDKTQRERLEHELKMSIQEHVNQMDATALQADINLAMGQLEVNKEEAASGSLFRGGWRPAVGWICASGLAIDFLVRPLFPWTVGLFTITPIPAIPALDMGTLTTLLFGMLGLGGMRTWEKYKGLTK